MKKKTNEAEQIIIQGTQTELERQYQLELHKAWADAVWISVTWISIAAMVCTFFISVSKH